MLYYTSFISFLGEKKRENFRNCYFNYDINFSVEKLLVKSLR